MHMKGGGPLVVGERLAFGGEAEVFKVTSPSGLVLKRFRDAKLLSSPDLQARVEAAVAARPPRWREAASGHVLLAWPQGVVLEGNQFVGLVMPRVDVGKTVELHIVANPSDRREQGVKGRPGWVPGFTWQYLLQTAANLALATQVLHDGGVVIGDFNARNILVWPEARVTLVDCDSMQIRSQGRDFLCTVGMPEFTAPELIDADLKKTVRAPESDLFALAVHIYQLLMDGAHPFDGVWAGGGDKPKRHQLAKLGIFANAGDPKLTAQPSAITFQILPRDIQALFRRAFISGATRPASRPTGEEWHDSLEAAAADLTTCAKNKAHRYPKHNLTCPWCLQNVQNRPTQKPLPAAVSPSPNAPRTPALPPPPNVPRAPAPRPNPIPLPQAASSTATAPSIAAGKEDARNYLRTRRRPRIGGALALGCSFSVVAFAATGAKGDANGPLLLRYALLALVAAFLAGGVTLALDRLVGLPARRADRALTFTGFLVGTALFIDAYSVGTFRTATLNNRAALFVWAPVLLGAAGHCVASALTGKWARPGSVSWALARRPPGRVRMLTALPILAVFLGLLWMDTDIGGTGTHVVNFLAGSRSTDAPPTSSPTQPPHSSSTSHLPTTTASPTKGSASTTVSTPSGGNPLSQPAKPITCDSRFIVKIASGKTTAALKNEAAQLTKSNQLPQPIHWTPTKNSCKSTALGNDTAVLYAGPFTTSAQACRARLQSAPGAVVIGTSGTRVSCLCPAVLKTLPTISKIGQSQVWTAELQRALITPLGFTIADLNTQPARWGTYTAGTASAVAKFQNQVKLTPDGVVGLKTWQAIRSKVCT